MIEIKQVDNEVSSTDTALQTIKIVKRDGRLVDFDDRKIYDALIKAEQKIRGTLGHLPMNEFKKSLKESIKKF